MFLGNEIRVVNGSGIPAKTASNCNRLTVCLVVLFSGIAALSMITSFLSSICGSTVVGFRHDLNTALSVHCEEVDPFVR